MELAFWLSLRRSICIKAQDVLEDLFRGVDNIQNYPLEPSFSAERSARRHGVGNGMTQCRARVVRSNRESDITSFPYADLPLVDDPQLSRSMFDGREPHGRVHEAGDSIERLSCRSENPDAAVSSWNIFTYV